MDSLLVHVGLHKTGSTSLQRSLSAAGRLSPVRRIEAVTAESLASARTSRRVVSSEGLLGSMRTLYAEAGQRLRTLELARVPLHIVLFVREPVAWHQAMFIQRIQEGEAISPAQYMSEVSRLEHFRISRLLDRVREMQREHTVSILMHTRDVVSTFQGVSGLELVRPPRASNVSMSPARAILASRINANIGSSSHKTVRQVLQHSVPPTSRDHEYLVFGGAQMELLEPAVIDWRENVLPSITAEDVDLAPVTFESEGVDADAVLSEAVIVLSSLLSSEAQPEKRRFSARLKKFAQRVPYVRTVIVPYVRTVIVRLAFGRESGRKRRTR